MIAIDSNILVYAYRQDSLWHVAASLAVKTLSEGAGSWAIPWPCIHEFISIVTHPRIYALPSPLEHAAEQINVWMGSPGLQLLSESANHWAMLMQLAKQGRIVGPRIHDTRIAALCMQHGVNELWTADRDFSRFPALKVKNPLVE